MYPIRQISDAVLHTTPRLVNFNSEKEIAAMRQDAVFMQQALYQAGGVGIAANQCAVIDDPFQMLILGTNDKGVRESVQQRYPGREIPKEILMVNPQILEYGGEIYYPLLGEGCLSVAGAIRAQIPRYTIVTAQYHTVEGNCIETIFSGFEAHIMQHEFDHLQGLVYLQKALQELSMDERQRILVLVQEAIKAQKTAVQEPVSLKPHLIFYRDGTRLLVNEFALAEELVHVMTATLKGIEAYLNSIR